MPIFLLLIALAVAIPLIIHNDHVKYVKRVSPIYLRVKELTQGVSFHRVKNTFAYHKRHDSKASYDRTSIDSIFFAVLHDDSAEFMAVLSQVQENRKLLKELLEEVNKVMNAGASDVFRKRYKYFEKIEKKQCRKLIPKPVTTMVLTVTHSYRSPQGRNYYEDSRKYGFEEIFHVLLLSKQMDERLEAARQTKEYQRSLMKNSLRYDVMKRDGFKCVLCGATAADGAKLQVDHIFPVSKGGRTEMSNLRTLCKNCNLGKRDKYDPNGVN
jgi:5-methylcytosine-specific restriction endonuclease McrA